MYLSLAMFFWCQAGIPELQRTQLRAFDFVDEENPATMLEGVAGLGSNGHHLFVMAANSPYVLELDSRPRLVRRIGRRGNGPEDTGIHGLQGLAVTQQGLFVISNNGKPAMHYYEKGEHLFRFNLLSMPMVSRVSNIFAVSDQQIMTAAHAKTGHLGLVYDYGGGPEARAGKLLPMNKGDLRYNPAINDTYWQYDGTYWYCLFKYRPFLRVYNRDFTRIKEWTLQGPEISKKEKDFFARAEKKIKYGNISFPFPYFDEFKLFGNHLYFTCGKILYKLRKDDGRLISRTAFYGEGPGFEEVTPGGNLNLSYFAFLNTGRLVLASRFNAWGSDLWTVDALIAKPLK